MYPSIEYGNVNKDSSQLHRVTQSPPTPRLRWVKKTQRYTELLNQTSVELCEPQWTSV